VKHLKATQIKEDFSSVVNEVVNDKERVILTRRGKELVAIVPIEDVKLLEELEDRQDVEAALAAEKEAVAKGETPIPWKKARDMLDL